MTTEIKINLDLLTGITPYIFAVDRELTVTWASPAIRRRVPEAVGTSIMDLIVCRAPAEELSPGTISELIGAVFKFSLRQGKSALPLAGRWLPSGDGFLLMASPAPENSEELSLFSFDDFPEEDHTVELLVGREEAQLSLREAKEAVTAFKKSEEKCRRIFELIPDVVVLLDSKFRFLEVNNRLFDWLGFTREEVLGKHLLRLPLLPWKSKLKVMRNFTRRMAGREVPPYDLEFRTRSGGIEFGRIMATPLTDDDGHATADLIFIANITEQKRAREALHESEERLELAVTGTNLGLWDEDVLTGKSARNRQWFEMLGYTPEEVELRTDAWTGLIHPDDVQMVMKKYDEHLAGKTPLYEAEFRLKTKTGEWKWIQSVGRVSERDNNGKPLRILGTQRDITEQKRAEEALRESEERLELAVTGANLGLWDSNLITGENTLNRQYAEIIGYEPGEIGPDFKSFKKLVHPDDLPGMMKKLNQHLEGETSFYEAEFRMRTKTGGWKWIQSAGRVSGRDNNGKPLRILGTQRDITERKRGEEVLKRAKEEALALSAKLQEAIKQANRMAIEAQSANRAKSEFLANMSHEIRTPMNGVIGMAELLLDTDLTDEQREFTGMIGSSADALLQIINDVLDFSKIEAGKLELEMIDFELRPVVEETAEMLAVIARRKGNELTCLIADDLPTILRGDPGRLRQILINLINNAIKFTENGEIAIRVESASAARGSGNQEIRRENIRESGNQGIRESGDQGIRKSGDQGIRGPGDQEPSRRPTTAHFPLPTAHTTIRFSITDTGIGIPGNKQARLFQSFSQIDASTTRKYGGTGLGLAIARQLADLMGGEIGVESEEEKGSTFWFTAVFEERPERIKRQRIMTVNLEGKRILVVDDNQTNRIIVSTYLSRRSARISDAEGGEEALRLLREASAEGDPFHLAIVDMMMPGMDGEALGRAIKDDPILRETTILIMLSSDTWQSSSDRLKEIGFADHLTKPIRPSRLFERLAVALGRTDTEAETGKETPSPTPEVKTFKRLAGPARILLVEDNPVNRMVALRMIEKLGYQADVVGNGKEALQALELIPYELVLMDCQMPEMDGFEATRKIREREAARDSGAGEQKISRSGDREIRGSGDQELSRKPTTAHCPLPTAHIPTAHIPIIAMTAHALRGDRERCLDAGMDDYIAKPVKQAILSAAIKKYLPPGEVRIKSILIVDDDENICTICRRILEENGYTVRVANDGQKGLELIEQSVPDLLLLDLNLPEITGPAVLKKIRELKLPITIVLITAFGDSVLMEQALEFSPFTVLRKPFAANDILRIVAGLGYR